MTTTVLKGAALMQRARDLAIPGRSRMSADELRAAIDAVSAPVPTQLPDQVPMRQVKINSVHPVTPFRARNGKHKPSARHTCRRVR